MPGPFLTLIDPRAKTKGSRDPLGLQTVWTRLGRQLIGNLTTVTTSVREFSVLLLGLYCADRWVEEKNLTEAHTIDAFLCFEQLAAYSRYARRAHTGDNENGIRGILRVKSRLEEGRGQVTISANTDGQILSNQKTYGVWGLYTVAAQNSGWVEHGAHRLTPETRDDIDRKYAPTLDRVWKDLTLYLGGERKFAPRQNELGRVLANILQPQLSAWEKEFYYRHLVAGGQASGRQAELWQLIKRVNRGPVFQLSDPFSMLELRETLKQATQTAPALVDGLTRIQVAETVLAPAAALFGLVLARDGQSLAMVTKEVETTWGKRLAQVEPEAFAAALATLETSLAETQRVRLIQVAEQLVHGDYESALRSLIAQNQEVMAERGGSAWVQLKPDGQHPHLDVRFLEESATRLPALQDLPDLWFNTYFLNALKVIGAQIDGASLSA